MENDDLLNDIANENSTNVINNNVDNNHFNEDTINNIVNEEINNITALDNENNIVNEEINNITANDESSEYEGMYNDLKDNTDRSREYRKKLIHEINDGQHKQIIEYLLNKIIGKSYSTHSTNKKHIIKWLDASQSRQPYVLLKEKKITRIVPTKYK